MAKDSALYQLMDIRMNGVMNDITNSDGEYQEIIRKSNEYSDALNKMELPKEVRRLNDRYISEQNALGSRYGMLAYLLGFSDCKAMFWGNACLPGRKKWFQKCKRKLPDRTERLWHSPSACLFHF